MENENPLRISEQVVIDSLPFDLGHGLQVRGLVRQDGDLKAWVVNDQDEGNWWTFQQIRDWWALEQQYEGETTWKLL